MEIKIDIDNEFCDEIVAARLVDTYRCLSADVESGFVGPLDLEDYKRVLEGLDKAAPWFVYDWDKKKKGKK